MCFSSPFIGRRLELMELQQALNALLSGQGGVFLLEGAPGIGKTRLIQEFAAGATSRGGHVLWGICAGNTGDAPELWPRIHTASQQPLGIDLQATACALTEISLPQKEAIYRPVRIRSDINDAPFTRLEQSAEEVRSMLADRARSEPLVIIFEDADLPSLELLGAIGHDLPQVLIIMTCNTAVLCKVSHQENVFTRRLLKKARRLHLKTFDGDEFVQLVRSYAGFNLDPDKMRMVQQMSGGNPRFAELIVGSELARLRDCDDEGHLSPMLRIAAGSHLQMLSEHARLLLVIAAMIGSTFELKVLEQLCDDPHDQVLDAIWEADACGVIAPVANRSGSYAFVYNLVREALRADLPKGQAARLHKRIGQALVELHGFEHEYLPEIATHFFHGPPADDTNPWPGRYCQRAAEYAESSYDFPKAISFYRMALASLHPDIVGVDGLRCDLLLALARAQIRNGDRTAAAHSTAYAAEFSELNHDPVRFAHAALVLAGSIWHLALGGRDAPQIAPMLEKSLRMLGNSMEPVVASVATRLAAELYSRNCDVERQSVLLDQAAVIAERSNDLESKLSGLRYRHLVLLSQPDCDEERLSNADKMLSNASAQGNDHEWCVAFHLRQTELLRMGDLMRAEVEAAALAQAVHTTGKAVFAEVLSNWATMRALLDGRFEEALRGAQRFFDHAEKTKPEVALSLFLPCAVIMLRELGRLDEVEQTVARGAESHPWALVLRAALAQTRLGLGDIDKAHATLRGLLGLGFADMERNASLALYAAMLAELCDELNVQSHTDELYEKLLPYRRGNIVLGPIIFAGPAARYLGILATMQDRFEQAEAHFLEALRLGARTAAWLWIAYTEIDYSRMLLIRNRSDDRELASRLIASALKTARALKMNGLLQRVQALEECLEAALPKMPAPRGSGQSYPVVDQSKYEIAIQQPALPVTSAPALGYAPADVTEQLNDATRSWANIFKREGDYWTIVFDHKTIRLKHAKGLSMIVWLLRHPRHEFLALTLERLAAGGLVPDTELVDARLTRELVTRAEVDDSGPLLDPQARTAYRQRLKDLHENCDEARSFNDIGRLSQAEAEIDFLERELCRGVGLSGRARKWPSETERSRVNVTNAIRSIISRLRKENPELARYLSNTIKTGRFCSFEPDPLVPVEWIV